MVADFDLLTAWRGGDKSAGSELFERHFESLRRFFRTKAPVNEVEDLVQRTLLACLESVANFRAEAKFRTYLFTIARRELYGFIERRTRDKIGKGLEQSVGSIRDLGISPSRAALANEEQTLIAEAMSNLPVDAQVTLELYYWEQIRGPELAEVLGISPATVRTRLHRARAALREALQHVRFGALDEARLDESVSKLGAQLSRC
ncbi:MAG: RNA polymerase sigma factor [Nannocystales bacterium]